tara:strand:- start:608 stop:1240 length:633 start_codon:yes stop_codon:yes gene_type:complete
MKIVSLIPARGGSKGISNKNIVDINGKPLIYYTINAALNCEHVKETWVSTDCENIADISDSYGAEVIWRPKELANDIIMPDASLVHFANNVDFDIIVFIQPTSPLLESKYIDMGLSLMEKYDSVFSVYEDHWLPKWENNKPYGWDINNRPRRQDAKKLYVENGAFYITTKKNLLDSELRYSGNIGMVEMPYEKSFQVDSINDLKLIRKLL